jgi:hypothetical protein
VDPPVGPLQPSPRGSLLLRRRLTRVVLSVSRRLCAELQA